MEDMINKQKNIRLILKNKILFIIISFLLIFLFSIYAIRYNNKTNDIRGTWSIDINDGSLISRLSNWGSPYLFLCIDRKNNILFPPVVWTWELYNPEDTLLSYLSDKERENALKIKNLMNKIPVGLEGKMSVFCNNPDSLSISGNHPLSGRYAFYRMQKDAYSEDGHCYDYDYLVLSNDSSYICMKRIFQKIY